MPSKERRPGIESSRRRQVPEPQPNGEPDDDAENIRPDRDLVTLFEQFLACVPAQHEGSNDGDDRTQQRAEDPEETEDGLLRRSDKKKEKAIRLIDALQVKPAKGRRKDLKKIDLLIGELQKLTEEK